MLIFQLSEIQLQVISIIANILDLPVACINPESSPSDFIEWDSISNMNIWVSVVDHFNVDIAFDAYILCESVSDIVELLRSDKC